MSITEFIKNDKPAWATIAAVVIGVAMLAFAMTENGKTHPKKKLLLGVGLASVIGGSAVFWLRYRKWKKDHPKVE